jgi:arylsulfatase A-like enzyme
LEQNGRAVDVLRRQGDGTWRFLVDNTWVTALLDHGSAPDQEVAARVCEDTVSEGR